MSKYIEKLDYIKTLENKVFTLNDASGFDFGDNKFIIGNGKDDEFMVCVLDEIGWVESSIIFQDILRECFTVKEILGTFEEFNKDSGGSKPY